MKIPVGVSCPFLPDETVVILDLSLPDSFGFDTFAKVYAHSPAVPIIVLTGNDDDQLALAAVKHGAQDYLVKNRLDRELLVRSMRYSIERKRYQVQLEHQANYDALTGCRTATCCTTACARRCTRRGASATLPWCSWTSTTSSSSTTAWAIPPATSC